MRYEVRPCTEEDEELIEEKLNAISDSLVPPEGDTEEEELVFKIADREGRLMAGCIPEVDSRKIAELDILWVAEEHRRQGLGSALIRAAEKAAREKGCYVMLPGTFDFQARPLCEKHGFTLTGTVRDWPGGRRWYELEKRF